MALVAAVAGSGPETLNARGRGVSPALGSAVQAGRWRRAGAPAPPPGRVSGTDFYVLGNGMG
ncbi:MAG: hypothetical protein C4337_08845 [Armatimonadota bacterium]